MQFFISLLQQSAYIIIGILGISALIFFHELGHFLFCKLFGIRTPSFSIGFGPRIASKKIWDTDFVISAIPLGGYVEIAGLAEVGQGDQTDATLKGTQSFTEKPYYQKFLVMMGGIAFNLLFAYVVFSGIHTTGVPASNLMYLDSGIPVIANFISETPAENSKLKKGDTILSINGMALDNSIIPVTKLIAGTTTDSVTFKVERNDRTKTITIPFDEHLKNHIGIVFKTENKAPAGLITGIKRGIQTTHRWIVNTAFAYMNLFKKRDMSGVGGPIKIISMMSKGAADGLVIFLLFLAIISVNLAVFNLIPVPILDGGQLLIHTLEALVGRSLPEKAREYIFLGTWIIFLILIVYLSFYDIKGLVEPYITPLLARIWPA